MKYLAFFPLVLFGFIQETMLFQSRAISKEYAQEIAKAPPPSPLPDPESALKQGSVWFTIDQTKANHFLDDETNWSFLREIGFDAIQVKGVRKSLNLLPFWEGAWNGFAKQAKNFGLALVGKTLGGASRPGPDFVQALENNPAYQNLYHMVEIPKEDWANLPKIPAGNFHTNVPWIELQNLYHKGYVPQNFAPYVRKTKWNTTGEIVGQDGKVRRWIYLTNGEDKISFDFLSPSFTASSLLAADALFANKTLGMSLLEIDGEIEQSALATYCSFIRKIGGSSASKTQGTLQDLSQTPADLTYDIATRPALLHALITQDAEALRMIYRLFLHAKIEAKRLIHTLEPFDQYALDWIELTRSPKIKFLYHDEQVVGEILKKRLLKEDVLRLKEPSTWTDYCARAINAKDFVKNKAKITKAHLLLAFTYAMQPGVFSLSFDDLLGSLPNNTYLYDDLPFQMNRSYSFASDLRNILQMRSASNIQVAELVDVMPSPNPGTLLLLYRHPTTRLMQLLAVNFADKPVDEIVVRDEIIKTNAIDLGTNLMEEKVFSSNLFPFSLAPLSGKAILFQSRSFD